MSTWNPPYASQLAELQRLSTRRENRTYFFDRLENPEWVPALAEGGFFDAPPEPVRDEDQGTIWYPPWPEGRYLTRMAPKMPDAVAGVLERIPPTSNPSATRTLLETAQALPDGHFNELSQAVLQWIELPARTYSADDFAEEAASVISRLARIGATDACLKVARELMTPTLRGTRHGADSDDEFEFSRPEAVGRLDDWLYERAVEQFLPDLVDAAGLDGLKMFSSLLDAALRLSSREGEAADGADFSYIWRPAIEDHEQNSHDGVRDLLVVAVRNAAVRLAAASPDNLVAVVQQLEKGTVLHSRIALHVLAQGSSGVDLVTERVTNKALFDDYRIKHEYAALLRSRFGELAVEARQVFLDWIIAGPDLADYRRWRTAQDGSAPSKADEAVYKALWQRDWLSFAAEHLTGHTAVLYRELVERYGVAEHPDFLTWTSSSSGSASPVSKEVVASWPPTRVLEYLNEWRPDAEGEHFGTTRDDVGRVFKEAVADRVTDFVGLADEIASLDPTYVRYFLDGIEAATKGGDPIDWDQVLRLVEFVARRPVGDDHDEVEDPHRGRDSGWRWTRGAIASLIEVGVADRDNGISFNQHQSTWRILELLMNDPDPTPEYEAANLFSMGPLALSMNTNRSKALRAVMSYTLWRRRGLQEQGVDVSAGFDLLPEARSLLEKHLRPKRDPSIAVRAVYGERLPWLALIDEQWVSAQRSRIFPQAQHLAALRAAAWNTYICWCRPLDPMLDLLRDEYEAAIERVPSGGTRDLSNSEDVDQKLGEHLLTFNWRGQLPRPMLERWFEVVDDQLAAHSMEFVGRALRNTQGDVDSTVLQQIRALWDWRIEVIQSQPAEHQLEASAFAATFMSSKLDEEWSLAALDITVAASGPKWLGRDVIERLAQVAQTKPEIATRIVWRILEGSTRDWDHVAWKNRVQDLLRVTIECVDAETVDHRSAIIDYYVKRGYFDFKELVRSPGPRMPLVEPAGRDNEA